jgi:lipoyl-dependent peroxiredoxin
MARRSTASTVWTGDLETGDGRTSFGSDAIGEVEVTWKARTEETSELTTPEELLAGAHASCYSMALAHGLSEAGNPPGRLETSATVTFVPGEGVKSSALEVKGKVDGIDQEAFEKAADDAGSDCPISQALKGNVEISVEAALES